MAPSFLLGKMLIYLSYQKDSENIKVSKLPRKYHGIKLTAKVKFWAMKNIQFKYVFEKVSGREEEKVTESKGETQETERLRTKERLRECERNSTGRE